MSYKQIKQQTQDLIKLLNIAKENLVKSVHLGASSININCKSSEYLDSCLNIASSIQMNSTFDEYTKNPINAWISKEDRQPDITDTYLAKNVDTDEPAAMVQWLDSYKNFYDTSSTFPIKVTHWMPIPK